MSVAAFALETDTPAAIAITQKSAISDSNFLILLLSPTRCPVRLFTPFGTRPSAIDPESDLRTAQHAEDIRRVFEGS